MIRILSTVFCGICLVFGYFVKQPWIAYAGVAFGGYFAVVSAWEALRAKELDVNVLMLLAAIGAIVVGAPLDATALMFLFSLSGTLEEFAMGRTRSAIEGLIKLRPSEATVVRGGKDVTVPVEQLVVGDTVRVSPHTSIPCDGVVVEGTSEVDQSAMTGESVAVTKQPDDEVMGGTINQGGMLLVRVSTEIENSSLSRIVNMVEEAQGNKASGELISRWFGERYTWFVLAAFSASFGFRMLVLKDPLQHSLYDSLTLLVALSPCALVISTPATTLSALAYAARRGVLIRGGRFIEIAGQIKAIAMDKTGTLTTGRPELVEICICHKEPATVPSGVDQHSQCWHRGQPLGDLAKSILRVGAALEQYASHPIAEAIVRRARQEKMDFPELVGVEVLPGLGIRAEVEGKIARIGQLKLYDHEEVSVPQGFLEHLREMADEGLSVALVQHGDEFAAVGLRDEPRPEAKAVLQELRSIGVSHLVMATGDNAQTAKAVGTEVGVDEVFAGLMPQEKERRINELGKSYGPTMMIGDGINDAPSLATASLGVAMGGLGSDIAMNAADIVLMHDNLSRLPELIRLGRKTGSVIKTNLIFAAGVILALSITSLFTTLPLPIAVMGHEGSTVLVILNGLRLLRGPGHVQPLAQ